MPIDATFVGHAGAEQSRHVDPRWLMAYAAALGHDEAHFLDTTRAEGLVAHPLFPVCLEWPAVLAAQELSSEQGITVAERRLGVHSTHDLIFFRALRAGDTLRVRPTISEIRPSRSGTSQVVRLDMHREGDNALVCSSWYGMVFRGVTCRGEGGHDPNLDPPPLARPVLGQRGAPTTTRDFQVPATFAHIYTECSRIWNPVHTDRQIAVDAGLPGIILHGTANLAVGLSEILRANSERHPNTIRRVRGRFRAMVRMPQTLRIEMGEPEKLDGGGEHQAFEVHNEAGEPAVAGGLIVYGKARS